MILVIRAIVANVQQNVLSAERTNMREAVIDPKFAQFAMVLTPPPPKTAQSGRKRKKVNISALKNAFPSLKPESW